MNKKQNSKRQQSSKRQQNSHNEPSFHFEFLNNEQSLANLLLQKHDISFLSGVAGTGKTMICAQFAVSQLLQKKINKIYICRPLVEAGEKIGFLPGTIDEKLGPWLLPIYSCFDDLIGTTGVQREFVNRSVELVPLAFMRGVTIKNAVAILDEAQNATYKQIKLFLTRIGYNGKLIVNGDPSQIDLPPNQSGFVEAMDRLNGVEGIGCIKFSEKAIVRHPIIKELSARL